MVISGRPHSLCFGGRQLSHGYDFRIARHFCRTGRGQKAKGSSSESQWPQSTGVKHEVHDHVIQVHLAMDNREDHPRVSVGTVQDWQKLKSYYRAAFIQAITQIASTQGLAREQNVAVAHMEQVYFSLIESISLSNTKFSQWIERTFNYAQPNLRINGNAFESLDESARGTYLSLNSLWLELISGLEMEPFDEALDRRIWSLADTRLQWHKRIAEARRTIPSEIEANISKLREQHRELDTASASHPDEDMEETVDENGTQL